METLEFGDFISVQASIENIEHGLHTQLGWFYHKRNLITKNALRALSPIRIPNNLQEYISFVSLNAPANFMGPKTTQVTNDYTVSTPFNASVSVTAGNEEALISFKAFCGDASMNNYNPPCTNLDSALVPTSYQVAVTPYANQRSSNPTQLDTDPLIFNIRPSKIYCFNTFSKFACGGEDDGRNCTCTAKVSSSSNLKIKNYFSEIISNLCAIAAISSAEVHSAACESDHVFPGRSL